MKTISNPVENVAGMLCKKLLPIKQEFYVGKGKNTAICTLSSIDLLKKIFQFNLMNHIAICGRLLTENIGIDMIMKFTSENPNIKSIVVCGKEVSGHSAGQALLAVARNGVDQSGRIIGAIGPHPILNSSPLIVDRFRQEVRILDMIGTISIDSIATVLVT